MYAWNGGGGEDIRVLWMGWVFHELSSSETPSKTEMSEESAETRESRLGLYVGDSTLSLAFAASPSSSTLRADARTQRSVDRRC